MLGDEDSIQETHYEILSVNEDASFEDIRSGYRSAILNSHPDKAADSTPKFLRVQKAWETLSDSISRAAYDNELRSSRQEDAGASEDIGLEDMAVGERDGEEGLELRYQCRCGDYFCVGSLELGRMGYNLLKNGKIEWIGSPEEENGGSAPAYVVLPCDSCSLLVRLLFHN